MSFGIEIPPFEVEYIIRSLAQLVISALCASIIGYEREMHGRPAGLRTHILVSVGATLFTLASVRLGVGNGDPGRIAAQIVSGIGFLGAGTIIHQGSIIKGLTTAATLWTVAGIGLTVGVGGTMVWVAVLGTIVIFLTLTILRKVEHWIDRQREVREIVVTTTEARKALRRVVDLLDAMEIEVRASTMARSTAGSDVRALQLTLYKEGGVETNSLARQIADLEDVLTVDWI